MIRLLVLSDTHGWVDRARDLLEAWAPQIQGVAHLGDFDRDALYLKRFAPHLPFYVVRGNNDTPARGTPETLVLNLEGHVLLLTHGHRHQVHRRPDILGYAAEEAGAGLALFGHIHVPMWETIGPITYLNPGSLAYPRNAQGPTFATLELEKNKPPQAQLWLYGPKGAFKPLH